MWLANMCNGWHITVSFNVQKDISTIKTGTFTGNIIIINDPEPN